MSDSNLPKTDETVEQFILRFCGETDGLTYSRNSFLLKKSIKSACTSELGGVLRLFNDAGITLRQTLRDEFPEECRLERTEPHKYKDFTNLIVINTCYGGWGLSVDALRELSKRSGQTYTNDWDVVIDNSHLIQLLKEWKSVWVSGPCAHLELALIGQQCLDARAYRVNEYDGQETIEYHPSKMVTYYLSGIDTPENLTLEQSRDVIVTISKLMTDWNPQADFPLPHFSRERHIAKQIAK